MRWTVHGERAVYSSEWMSMSLVDVEVPGGRRFEHHVVRFPQAASGVVVRDDTRGVLMLWRHRFITDTWGWEVPAGRVEPGESPERAAEREVLEETGYLPHDLRQIGCYAPSNGVSDQVFHVFTAEKATHMGEPIDRSESERVEWLPLAEVRKMIADGKVFDGLSLTALLWSLFSV